MFEKSVLGPAWGTMMACSCRFGYNPIGFRIMIVFTFPTAGASLGTASGTRGIYSFD